MDETGFLAVHPDPVVRYGRPDGDLQVQKVNPAFESTFSDADGSVDLADTLSPVQERPELATAIKEQDTADIEVTIETMYGDRPFRLRNVPADDGGYLVFTDIVPGREDGTRSDEQTEDDGSGTATEPDSTSESEPDTDSDSDAESETDRDSRIRDLEEQNERLEAFASIVSHDLRNPIDVAETYLQAARENGDPEQFDRIEDALTRMRALIDDVLALARQGQVVDDTERVTLATRVENAWDSVDTDETTLELADDTATLQADPDRLEQLVGNLFRNVVEHGGSTITVGTFETDDGTGWYLEDDGPGIPEEERADIFEPGVTNSTDGTGLGLAIVERIAEAHDWEVSVTDGTAGGARFEFTEMESLQPF